MLKWYCFGNSDAWTVNIQCHFTPLFVPFYTTLCAILNQSLCHFKPLFVAF